MQDIFLLIDKNRDISLNKYIIIKKTFESFHLTENILLQMVDNCSTEYFYVISPKNDVSFLFFDFKFKPIDWDKEYMHIWNNDSTIRLFHKETVRKNPHLFTDSFLRRGKTEIKSLTYKVPPLDIIFLSYDELYADENYQKLKSRFPRTKRIHGVKGIMNAHIEAARISNTEYFYVVDADAEISHSFNFDYLPSAWDLDSVHVWYSQNPINDLVYGYGGVKLFPRKKLLDLTNGNIDFTTGLGSSKVIPEISNITQFNMDPFSTWRSAFRECAKLSSKIIPNQDNTETEERLKIWCTVGADRDFGDLAIAGANEGAEFGRKFADQPEQLKLINDFDWLAERYSN
jgi:hypothetical protein